MPSVVVLRAATAEAAVLREVCAGAEEEGVPTRVGGTTPGDRDASPPDAPSPDAIALAHTAALDSRLDVGIGLDGAGAVAVHHAKLPERGPAEVVAPGASAPDWRRAGRTAARIVKGLPFV